jgi:ferrous iron transport protein B
MKKILLMGNPNVGKSVIFSRLTGVNVVASNYPGTTVEFTQGHMTFKGERAEVIDVPGTYTLEPTSKAEEVACEMMKEGDIVIDIVDATNLERNLRLTMDIIDKKVPTIVALNIWDETKHMGIDIDVKKLEELLGVPVVTTVAPTGEGIKELVLRLEEAKAGGIEGRTEHERWDEIGRIVNNCQRLTHRHHTLLERFGDASVRPLTGIPIGVVAIYIIFKVIRFIGEFLVGIAEGLFDSLWTPVVMRLSEVLDGFGFIHDVLVGKLIGGEIDYFQSFGLLSTGLYVPFAAVLPYIIAFYLILGILEDIGFLPRFAVLVDTIMHRVGLHGSASISMFLGLGCNVPGILATRVLETRRERFIAATLLAICVPCMALNAMVVGLVGQRGGHYVAAVFGILFIVWIILGSIVNRIVSGDSTELYMEIPPYRIPYLAALLKKFGMRVRQFIVSAVPLVLLGVLIVNMLYSLGIIQFLGKIVGPLITGVLGLPQQAISALIIGFLRKDVAVGMLAPLNLTGGQLVVACVVLSMYFPCVATFAIMFKELGIKDMSKSAVIMLISAFSVGGILNAIFRVLA